MLDITRRRCREDCDDRGNDGQDHREGGLCRGGIEQILQRAHLRIADFHTIGAVRSASELAHRGAIERVGDNGQQSGLEALFGAIAGLATALACNRLIESLLYGVSPRPFVFAGHRRAPRSTSACRVLPPRAPRGATQSLEALRTE
jgi:hypothetical protein